MNRRNMDTENRMQNETRTPLLPEENPYHSNKDEGNSISSNTIVYFSTFVAVCGSFAVGSCVGYSSPAETAIRKDLSLTIAEYSFFASILTFGGMIGAITSGRLADLFGRKGAMRVASAFCAVGWLTIFAAKGPISLDIGRLATGIGMGVYSYVIPVFVSEIAPKNLRGFLTNTYELMLCTGGTVAFVLGTFLTWRSLALTGLVPCAIQFFGLFLIPESPRWLAKMGNKKGFEVSLRKLRGKDADITNEAAEIQDYIDTLEKLPKASILELFQRKYLRSVTIGVGLMLAQQLGGINGVYFYASSIFESAGISSKLGTSILPFLQVVMVGTTGSLFIDRLGRKPLLQASASGLALGCLLTALSFYFTTYQIALKAAPPLAVTGLLVYIGFSEVGMGAVPWVVMSEIFPLNVKGSAGSLATLVNWSGAWLVSYSFKFLMSWSSYGTFLLYAGVNVLAIFFVMKVVPETKGRTLEQIQAAINA